MRLVLLHNIYYLFIFCIIDGIGNIMDSLINPYWATGDVVQHESGYIKLYLTLKSESYFAQPTPPPPPWMQFVTNNIIIIIKFMQPGE